MDKTRISPSEFTGAIKRLSKATYKTGYVPQKVKRALRTSGASRFQWQSATKRQFMKTIGGLQAEGALKAGKLFTPKRIYEDAIEEREADDAGGSSLPLATGKLPGRLTARNFIEFYGRATGRPGDAKAALQALHLPTGGQNPRTGGEPELIKRQMLLVLEKLRAEGKLVHPNIGKDIARSHRQMDIFIQEGRDPDARYQAKAHEDLPEGIQRSIGRPPAGSALRSATGQERSTSVGRAAQQQQDSDELETNATTASKLSRQPTPNDPKTSISRRGRSRQREQPSPVKDLPFDID